MFYTITSQDITTMTGYASGLIGDLMPLILVLLGVGIALFIYRQLTK